MSAPFDPGALISVLDEHDVDFVLIGGLAAVLHGSSAMTNDADVMPDPDAANLDRLATALRSVDARLRVEREPGGVAFEPHPTLLASVTVLNLTTRFGDLDLAVEPAGLDDYATVRSDAVVFDVDGIDVYVAALDDIIRSKRVADRPKDRVALPILLALRDEIAIRERMSEPG